MNARPTMQGKQAAEPGAAGRRIPPSARNACVGADDLIGPPTGLAGGCLFRVISRSRPQCRAGDFARRLGFAASQGLRDDASIVPYGRGARPCRGLRDTCGTRPPAGVNARPTMQGKQAAEPGGAAGRRMPPSARNACVGADDLIGPPTGLAGGCLFRVISRSRPQCRAGVFARRLGSAASQGLRDDASIVPYGCRARPCRGLRDTCGARRQCTLALPVSFRVAGSPCRRVPA